MLMQWGAFQFTVSTAAFNVLQRNNRWRWTAQQPIRSDPKHSYLGRDDETLRITGTLHSNIGGMAALDDLRNMSDRGNARVLMDGLGTAWGTYACKGIEEKQLYLRSDGTPRQQNFTIELVRVWP